MERLYQISHEELLLLSGLLQLPTPLALGPQPAAGYSRAAMQIALGAAASALAARGFLSPSSRGGEPPTPAPGIAGVIRILAAAERCLVLAGGKAGQHTMSQICLRADGEALLLSSPQPGAYRICAAHGHAAVIDHVVAALPPAHARPAPSLDVPPAALIAALDAAPGGMGAATTPLHAAGVPADEAERFARSLGPAPSRHALIALRRQERRGILAIVGADAIWCADDDRPESVPLRPVGPAELRAHIADLVAWAAA
ncbi:ESX secretion-associated protein EspG [Oscillochloris sp. ZM17-4]|uniref:ESX secretion-associated protein EspG n=1 Tax=Oscillochloris sp. ZM17-4 TaxID=2866714 RepID=UPI001C737263|nr:ESX secretion-associated protein EspG [Oscillochloris sp. ZM17-4]MBX0330385.1 ESX secretion-associated protein EspG [Oscillochloris sp. ZM17-4]